MTTGPDGRLRQGRARVVCPSERGYQPAVPPDPPLEELLLGEEVVEGVMKVVVSVMLMRWGGTVVESF